MSILSCNPIPFEDPIADSEKLLLDMTARIRNEEVLVQLGATEYEKKVTHQRRFLQKNNYEIEASLQQWKDWVKWRHGEGPFYGIAAPYLFSFCSAAYTVAH
jgi:hypothetical protein